MESIKKFMFLVVILSISLFAISSSFAESGESGENVVILDSIDEYEDIASPEDSSSSEEDELKQYYEEYREYLKNYYNDYKREVPSRAVVIEAGEVRDEYRVADYYSINKYTLQNLKVKVLEGEFKDKEVSVEYLLSADALDNIKMSPLQIGDKIFITVAEDAEGNLTGNATNSWSTVDRISVIVLLGIIAGILLLIYTGKKGFCAILTCILVILVSTLVIPILSAYGYGSVYTGIFAGIALILAICFAHLGRNKTAVKAALISVVLSGVSVLLTLIFNYLTRTVGTVFEFAAISENILLGNINFTELFMMIVFLISSGVIANTVCLCVKKIDRESLDSFNDKTDACKAIIIANVITIVIICMGIYIPNHILLITNKFNDVEIINSETLISEFVRMFAIVIPVILASPITALNVFKFGKKYLKSANISEVDIKEE